MSSNQLLFLKLGGSLITDKTQEEALRGEVLSSLSFEIAEALSSSPDIKLVLGHGSGSFGHVAAKKYDTRQGVRNRWQWYGFAEVSSSAARLNAFVRESLLRCNIPAVSLQPSASAECRQGQIVEMSTSPIRSALKAGLVPIIYGDVAFDSFLGGTIISTEEILSYLARELQPNWLLLAGETEGVLDANRRSIPLITRTNIEEFQDQLGSSRGTDVTGGMESKVHQMLDLVDEVSGLSVMIFSGLIGGNIKKALTGDTEIRGTVIRRAL